MKIGCFQSSNRGAEHFTHFLIGKIVIIFQIKNNPLLFGQLQDGILELPFGFIAIEPCTSLNGGGKMCFKIIKRYSIIFFSSVYKCERFICGYGV